MAAEISREQTSALIELYHDHSVLWDCSLKQYKDQRIRNRALESIQAQFFIMYQIKLEVKDIKIKLQSFRSSFCREVSKMNSSTRSGAADVYQPTYVHFKDLQFLMPVIKKRESQTNMELVPFSQSQELLSQSPDQPLEESSHFSSDDVADPVNTPAPTDRDIEVSWLCSSSGTRVQLSPDIDSQEEELPAPAMPQSRPATPQSRRATAQPRLATTQPIAHVSTHTASATSTHRPPTLASSTSRKRRPYTATDELSLELKSYLHNKRATQEHNRKEPSVPEDPDMIWAKNLIATLNELNNINTKKMLKLKLTGLVSEAVLKKLEQESM